jgi:hypothetical protein
MKSAFAWTAHRSRLVRDLFSAFFIVLAQIIRALPFQL